MEMSTFTISGTLLIVVGVIYDILDQCLRRNYGHTLVNWLIGLLHKSEAIKIVTQHNKLHYFALCVLWDIVCVRYGVRNYSLKTNLGPTPNVKSHTFLWNLSLSICQ